MEQITRKKLTLFAGRTSLALATDVSKELGVPLGDANISEFANGEIHCRVRRIHSRRRRLHHQYPLRVGGQLGQ